MAHANSGWKTRSVSNDSERAIFCCWSPDWDGSCEAFQKFEGIITEIY
jgi:hypothetical protein